VLTTVLPGLTTALENYFRILKVYMYLGCRFTDIQADLLAYCHQKDMVLFSLFISNSPFPFAESAIISFRS